jgi:DNA-binding SARP family transcriptional activator/pimeloyl-ACP methyl ester carboxylesterase
MRRYDARRREAWMSQLEFRILGPLEVLLDGAPLDLGTPRQRALLVALLLRHNRVVPTDQLLDELWGEEPSSGARHSLQVHIANLRKAIEPNAGRGEARVIVTKTPGYAIMIDAEDLDAARFERLAAETRVLEKSEAARRERLLREALGLWRGDALADIGFDEFAVREAARLAEARIVATEDLIDAELELRRHATLVGDIEKLVGDYPLRERLWAQLMLALYRSGRQAEALRAYERVRATLRDELGVEPSRELRDLNMAMLEQSPDLDREPPATFEPVDSPEAASTRPRSKPRRRWGVALAVAAVAAVLVAGITVLTSRSPHTAVAPPNAALYTPRFQAHQCSRDQLATVPGTRCGWLVVPENRTDPAKRWIRLEVARYPASNHESSHGPVVSIGWTGVREDPTRSPVRDHAELITIDTRVSLQPHEGALACPGAAKLSADYFASPSGDSRFTKRADEAFRECYQQLTKKGVDLSRYTYDDAADDVIDLARALHLDTLNINTEEEDSLVAYELVARAPSLVRSITLENPVIPGTTGIYDPTAELENAFNAYVALCRADAACNRAYPDLAAKLQRDESEENAHPIVATGSAYGAHYKVRLDAARGDKALAQALEARNFLGLIPIGLENGPTFRPDALVSLAMQADYFWSVPGFPWPVALSQWCSYDVYNLSPGRDFSARARPDLAGLNENALPSACAQWPVKKMPVPSFRTPTSDIPMLIVVGELYPYSLPQWPTVLQGGFKNASVVRFATLGRSMEEEGVPPCINELRRNFIAHPQTRLAAAACSAQSTKIPFATP